MAFKLGLALLQKGNATLPRIRTFARKFLRLRFSRQRAGIIHFERCRDIFGLTRAEAQVALGIMHGRSLGEIASSQGKAIATSRNLLKRVYMKTGVNRQNELAWVMMNSPLLLPNPRDSQPARQH